MDKGSIRKLSYARGFGSKEFVIGGEFLKLWNGIMTRLGLPWFSSQGAMPITPASLSRVNDMPSAQGATGFVQGSSLPSNPYRPTFLERIKRADYQRSIARISKMQVQATRGHGLPVHRRGEVEMSVGDMIWGLSTSYGVGMWSEAERAWVRGALLMTGNDPNLPLSDGLIAERVRSVLLKRGIIGVNPHGGVIDGDDYLVGRWVGAGSNATVMKVFGKPAAVKIFDGGITKFMTLEHQVELVLSGNAVSVEDYLRREADILRTVVNYDLGAAEIYEVFDWGFVRELVDGIVLGALETVLDLDEVIPARERAFEYEHKLREAGFTNYDGRLVGNLVYTREKEWVMIDY